MDTLVSLLLIVTIIAMILVSITEHMKKKYIMLAYFEFLDKIEKDLDNNLEFWGIQYFYEFYAKMYQYNDSRVQRQLSKVIDTEKLKRFYDWQKKTLEKF